MISSPSSRRSTSTTRYCAAGLGRACAPNRILQLNRLGDTLAELLEAPMEDFANRTAFLYAATLKEVCQFAPGMLGLAYPTYRRSPRS